MSLVISLALDFPKFITREPPPCIWLSRKKKSKMIRMYGRKLKITPMTVLPLGTWTL